MISHIDHIVLTVSDIDAAVAFYKRVLLMEEHTFSGNRKALRFGQQKINLQRLGDETRNNAQCGSGDLCLITDWSMDAVLAHLNKQNIEIIEGVVEKSGAVGAINSIYFLDPDKNLIEVSVYQ